MAKKMQRSFDTWAHVQCETTQEYGESRRVGGARARAVTEKTICVKVCYWSDRRGKSADLPTSLETPFAQEGRRFPIMRGSFPQLSAAVVHR
jgi:hypothetical protein